MSQIHQGHIANKRYLIQINSITIQLKFQCKILIQCLSQQIASSVDFVNHNVDSKDKIVSINQRMTLEQVMDQKYFEFHVYLATSQGHKYVAGVAHLLYSQLQLYCGKQENIISGLKKCLDQEAKISIKVIKMISRSIKNGNVGIKYEIQSKGLPAIKRSGIKNRFNWKKPTQDQTQVPNRSIINDAKNTNKNGPQYINVYQKNERFNRTSRYNSPTENNKASRNRMHSSSKNIHRYQHQNSLHDDHLLSRASSNSSYKKLDKSIKKSRQSTKTQMQKRLATEDNEAAAKLEIIKFKIRCEQLENTLKQQIKNNDQLKETISQLNHQLIQRKQNLIKLQLELKNKEILQKTRTNDRSVQEVKDKLSQLMNAYKQKQIEYKKQRRLLISENQQYKNILTEKEVQLKRVFVKLNENLALLTKKQSIIMKIEQEITRPLSNKLKSKEKQIQILQKMNGENQNILEQLRTKINQLTAQKRQEHQINEGFRLKFITVESNLALTIKGKKKMEEELEQFRKIKLQYNKALITNKQLEIENKNFHKKIDKLKMDHLLIIQNIKKASDKTRKQKQTIIEQSQKQSRELKNNITSLENKIQYILKFQLQKEKNTIEKLLKERDSLQIKQRKTKEELKQIEDKIKVLQTEFSQTKDKLQKLESIYKFEKTQNHKSVQILKNQIQKYVIRAIKLQQTNEKLVTKNTELLNKIQIQRQKRVKSQQQLKEQIIKIAEKNKIQEKSLQKLQQISHQARNKEQIYLKAIEQYNLNQNQFLQVLTTYQRQIKTLKTKYTNLQEQHAIKKSQLDVIVNKLEADHNKYKELSLKLIENQQQNRQLTKQNDLAQIKNNDMNRKINLLNQQINQKQKQIQKLKFQRIQQQKQPKQSYNTEFIQLKNDLEMIQKQNDRFRHYLIEVIVRQSAQIVQFLAQFKSLPKMKQLSATGSQIISVLIQIFTKVGKKLRQDSQKQKLMKQSIKVLHNDQRKLQEKIQATKSQHNIEIQKLSKIIQQNCKKYQTLQAKYDKDRQGLTKQLEQSSRQLEQVLSKNNELIYTLNGCQFAAQSTKQYYERIQRGYKKTISLLQQKYNNLQIQCNKLELISNQVSADLQIVTNQLKQKQLQADRLRQNIRNQQQEIAIKGQVTRQYQLKIKQFISKIAQLENIISSEKEFNESAEKILSEEVRKTIQANNCVNGLIKQKQSLLKQQISNKEYVLQLESYKRQLEAKISELQKNNHDQTQKNKKYREKMKMDSLKLMEVQKKLEYQENRAKKLALHKMDSQRELENLRKQIKDMLAIHQEQKISKSKDIDSYIEQIRSIKLTSDGELWTLKKQNQELISENNLLKDEINFGKNTVQNLQSKIQQSFHNYELKDSELHSFKQLCNKMNKEKLQLESKNEDLLNQLRQKDQRVYELAGQINSMEQQYYQKIQSMKSEIIVLENNMNCRYEDICEDYEAKVQQLQKQIIRQTKIANQYQSQYHKLSENMVILLRKQDKIEPKLQSKSGEHDLLLKLKQQIVKVKKQAQNQSSGHKSTITQKQKYKQKCDHLEKQTQKLQIQNLQLKSNIQTFKLSISELEAKVNKKNLQIKQLQQDFLEFQWILQRQIKKQSQTITSAIFEVIDANKRGAILIRIQKAEALLIKCLKKEAGDNNFQMHSLP